ncbi:unnamed protein product [Adineta ricciae]|uniref:B box-type domain-containing protein n=1 Tax=Adineta ricciae TaxID=249248 RepID=A0A815M5Y1_ADIRI|nr:unnamed protein product [Adineta ricciae]CAF1619722.1 unnamed protein product [Adineta ricciae]
MAACSTPADKCVACILQSNEEKAKPGIVQCAGCQKSFCVNHFVEHRKVLSDKLDGISMQRDSARACIEEMSEQIPAKTFKPIEDWKKEMLQTVEDTANTAKRKFQDLVIDDLEQQCKELTDEINSFRNNDNYFETDLRKLQSKAELLNQDLSDLASFRRIRLALPSLDSSNMVQMKLPEIEAVTKDKSETNDDSDTDEYYSVIQQFLEKYKPSVSMEVNGRGYICASSTMLIQNEWNSITRHVFHRESTSSFACNSSSSPLQLKWSEWLQQFIILDASNIMVADALEKVCKTVLTTANQRFKYLSSWKSKCVVVDAANRVFVYQMKNDFAEWYLLYCWSPPTSCAPSEDITAISINGTYIALAIKREERYRFVLHNYELKRCATIHLNHPCTSIQALPSNKWLLYDSTQTTYRIVDTEKTVQNEPYLTSLAIAECQVTCEKDGKLLVVLVKKPQQHQQENFSTFRSRQSEKNEVKIYDYQL